MARKKEVEGKIAGSGFAKSDEYDSAEPWLTDSLKRALIINEKNKESDGEFCPINWEEDLATILPAEKRVEDLSAGTAKSEMSYILNEAIENLNKCKRKKK